MPDAPPPRPIHPQIAGDTRVPLAELQRKLGRTGFAVWRDMVLHRSQEGGVFHGTLDNIAKRIEKTQRAVRHAMHRRLIPSGIVRDLGRKKLRVFVGRRVVEHKVRARTVHGAVIDSEFAVVPYDVACWLGQARGHGGFRWDGHDSTNTRGGSSGADLLLHPCEAESRAPLDPSGAHVPPLRGSSGAPDRTIGCEGSPESSLTTGRAAVGDPRHASGPLVVFRSVSDDKTVRQLGQPKHTRPGAPLIVGGVVPPYPGQTLVKTPTMPRPPLLSADMSDKARAITLVKAYNAAVSSRLAMRSFSYARGDITKAKPYKLLVEVAALMIDKKISPWGWCAWRLDEHVNRGHTDRPPITVVYARKVIRNQGLRHVYRRAALAYGGRTFMPPTLRTLLERYRHMQSAIHQRALETEGDLAAVVNEFFPPGEWGLLLEAAQKEAAQEQVRYQRAISDGEFIW